MIWAWLKRLFSKSSGKDSQRRHGSWPTREEMLLLPPFDALRNESIIEISTTSGAQRAYRELAGEKVVGFDTESKPTFVKGHVSTGPHVAQFATLTTGYVFVLHNKEIRDIVSTLIGLNTMKKVGFGLSEDIRRIRIKLGVAPVGVVDLETLFVARGYGKGVGVKVGVALALKRRFMKSKRASTSNWMRHPLSDQQLLYAANDAYAAIRVYEALGSPKL